MSKQNNILIIDDNKGVLVALQLLLKNYFNQIITLDSPKQLPARLSKEKIDVILLDMNFTTGINNGNEGLFWLNEIKQKDSSIPVVLFTAYADIELAVEGIKKGAADFIVKPWENKKLINTLLHVCKDKEKRKSNQISAPATEIPVYWGESPQMQQLKSMIEKVAATDANLLITGENGTGKEIIAREVHRLSNRQAHPMITVDMGSISETLFESELFGHKKGSFTDAYTDRTGKFEAAHNSTLFLDEIGNLSYQLQAKLLVALQSRAIIPVGSNSPVPVNIRLICATNKDISEMVEKGTFREDLLYRINTIHIHIPPLRERKEDIVPLAEIFLHKFCDQYNKPEIRLSAEAIEKLECHPWYGNIRELEHSMEKAVILNEGNILYKEMLQLTAKKQTPEAAISTLEDMEMEMIRKAIEKNKGNLTAVAAQLGITRQTLYNKMKKFGL